MEPALWLRWVCRRDQPESQPHEIVSLNRTTRKERCHVFWPRGQSPVRHNAPVPRVIAVAVDTPMTVHLATEVFGSDLRVHLIRHYRAHPGPQKAAAEALGVSTNAVSANTKVLIDAGVVVVEPGSDRRFQICRVDVERLNELLADVTRFVGSASD